MPPKMEVIDFHAHIVTPQFEKLSFELYPYHVPFYKSLINSSNKMNDIRERIRDIDSKGVDLQVLSLPEHPIDYMKPKDAVTVARLYNDELSEFIRKAPEDRFVGLAALPLKNVEASIEELERCIRDYGFKGFLVQTDVDGKPLDSTEFWPLYERAARLGAVLFIHGTVQMMPRILEEYTMNWMVGYAFNISYATLRLILSGLLDNVPSLKIVSSELGGYLPFISHRLDRFYEMWFGGTGAKCKYKPTHYLKQIYYDNASLYTTGSLMCAIDVSGADRIMMGSNYPAPVIGTVESARAIRSLPIAGEEKQKILHENAERLLGL
jgi:aminocarboxymuconate-semialdehyde decarboxylase